MKQSSIIDTQHFGFLLIEGFSILPFASAIEALRSANRHSGENLYSWTLLSPEGGLVTASSGVACRSDMPVRACDKLDAVIVCGGVDAHVFDNRQTLAWLRLLARQGAKMGAVSLGSYILARAGLLNGVRCTIHWENLAGFQEDYPQLNVTEELFEIDANRFTCSGGTAALDMMMSIIAKDHGRELATKIAENYIHERIRDQHDHQRMNLRTRLNISHPKLLNVIEMMQQNLEDPLPRSKLAAMSGLSTRQLERLFRKYLNRTPTRYYLELRLAKARSLLNQTSLSILDIAMASGFVSASHFSKCYREQFNRKPRDERQQIA
ncbi:GlxA family transcriptional regulator [Limibacillus sp. MBR-115]|jgi:transcriptional regulator GlxA family with amidase domain|uniref:GlxA family transcriptional regulator n=1 Tax=Limibacillus sp. MBR-115 TaxID=3156465 RepID=UPI003392E820